MKEKRDLEFDFEHIKFEMPIRHLIKTIKEAAGCMSEVQRIR